MNYEEYLREREIIVNENKNLVGNVLNEAEEKLDSLLASYKAALLAENETDRLYKMNLLSNRNLWDSDLYRLVRDLPKGADLHVHATALVPAWKLISFVKAHRELVVDPEDGHIYHENESGYVRDCCYPLADLLENGFLTPEELEKKWSMLGKAHSENVWEYFEKLLGLFESIEYDYGTLYDYYVFAFEDYIANNVTHLEIHAVLSDDRNKALELASVIKKAFFHVKDSHPDFSVSVICAGLKYIGVDEREIRTYLENAVWLSEHLKNDYRADEVHPFIIGFDLLNEEDKSVPLKNLAPLLLDYRNRYPDFHFFIHCGESLMAQSDNLVDAYLLGAKRVGHGMNLYRYPKLLGRYAENEICLECCVISNQTLKYTKDIRLHPGAEYLKRGVTVSLCSDDPVCQEHEQLTDDFFAAVVCWDLTLCDVKQLAINSILYSGADAKQKSALVAAWKRAWLSFVENYTKE